MKNQYRIQNTSVMINTLVFLLTIYHLRKSQYANRNTQDFPLFLPDMKQAFQPMKFAIILALGIAIGIWFAPYKISGGNKFSQIVQLINSNYVDTVNNETLEKEAINDLLHSLDPHSNYFSADEAKHVNEPLEGSFEGIGIEFLLLNDTIFIANVVDDGPSDKAGMMVGDRITKVDGKLLSGMNLKNEDVFKLLKGKGGSEVQLGIYRSVDNSTHEFKITRGSIPIKSVDGYFMAENGTGYIKISRFAANTFDEYKTAFNDLKSQGLKNLIIDLRDNGGGYLNTAQKIADEFLDADKKILTTIGKHTGNETYNATSKGSFETGKLIVLVNENSASASEILSGALQDNDRALIVGRRTFGKGLVQNSFSLKDGSAIRLTISRYYTPTGRSIQRPYVNGYNIYEDDYKDRYKSGELFFEDSIKNNTSEIFTTPAGRKVYGGGGIVPDIFVPLDTSKNSPLLSALISKSILRETAYMYAGKNKNELEKYADAGNFNRKFFVNEELVKLLQTTAISAGISWNDGDFIHSRTEIDNYLKSYIAKQVFKSNGYYFVENENDETFRKALACMQVEKNFEKMIK